MDGAKKYDADKPDMLIIPEKFWGLLSKGLMFEIVDAIRRDDIRHAFRHAFQYLAGEMGSTYEAAAEIARTMTHGEKTYTRENWRLNLGTDKGLSSMRLKNAAIRHVVAWGFGEKLDVDSKYGKGSNCHHLACCCCELLFELHRQEAENEQEATGWTSKKP